MGLLLRNIPGIVLSPYHYYTSSQLHHNAKTLSNRQPIAQYETLLVSGCDCACALVIYDDDTTRGDGAIGHLERRRNHATGK